ncbi:MAG: hypothetical protein LBG48_00710 [Rickettsiales bacterium]|jgi:transcription termination factor NusB|nr:hypothetical protein [Rickettsiales bacterium]
MDEKERILFKKSIARLVICQAVHMFFDVYNEEKNPNNILNIIDDYYVSSEFAGTGKGLCNSKFVFGVVEYVINNVENIDKKIKQYLVKEEPIETLDSMVVQILRVAIGEAEVYQKLSKNIIINEYVDIAGEFFNNIYISFINGVLTNIFNNNSKGKEAKNISNGRKILSLNK